MFVFAEVFPVLCGILIGLGMDQIGSSRLRRSAWFSFSLAAGLTANLIAGESRMLLLYDVVLVALCAQVVALLKSVAQRKFSTAARS